MSPTPKRKLLRKPINRKSASRARVRKARRRNANDSDKVLMHGVRSQQNLQQSSQHTSQHNLQPPSQNMTLYTSQHNLQPPSQNMTLRDSMLLRQMMGQQQRPLGMPQAPQSSVDSVKHDLLSNISRMDTDAKKEMQVMKEKMKTLKAAADRDLAERGAKHQRQRMEAEIDYNKDRRDGANEAGQLDLKQHELEMQRDHLKRVNQEHEDEIAMLDKQHRVEDLLAEIDELCKEGAVLKDRVTSLIKQAPTRHHENEAYKLQLIEVLDLMKEFDSNIINTTSAKERLARYRPHHLDGTIASLTTKLSEAKAALKVVVEKNQRYADREAKIASLKDEVSEFDLKLADEKGKRAYNQRMEDYAATEKSNIEAAVLWNEDAKKYNAEVFSKNPNPRVEDLKALYIIPNRTKLTQKERLELYATDKADFETQLEDLRIDNHKDKITLDAIRKAAKDANAAELELLQEKLIYDTHNPDSDAAFDRSNELITKTVAAEEARIQIDHAKRLHETQEKLVENRNELNAQVILNKTMLDPYTAITQAITDNIVLNNTITEAQRLRRIYQNTFRKLMSDHPSLEEALPISQDSFGCLHRETQESILTAIRKGIDGDIDYLAKFDAEHQDIQLQEAFREYHGENEA